MKILDLTLTISDNIPTFPGSPAPSFIPWENIKDDGYNLELLFFSSHTGTHLDAPYHFLEKGVKIHEINIKRLVCNAVLIKLRKKSGWQKNLLKDFYFTKNPGLSVSAANYLASKKINLVGIDAPSIDLGLDSKFSVHHILAKNNILIVENLANLDKINSPNFHLVIAPLKLKNATGSPVRALAFV